MAEKQHNMVPHGHVKTFKSEQIGSGKTWQISVRNILEFIILHHHAKNVRDWSDWYIHPEIFHCNNKN